MKLTDRVINSEVQRRNAEALAKAGVVLPKFSELADPSTIDTDIQRDLQHVGFDEPHPLNLFRVHWHNTRRERAFVRVPEHVVLPPSLTGVDAKIVVLLGNRFPMIRAHKVLAAYACLAPRIASGEFDLAKHRAVWPSTGNYCRGGVAVSRIVGCRGVAVLPAGMSAERFRWLEAWAKPEDIVRTPGTESNVKEIYDACARLERDPANVIFNQFAEYANYLVHNRCTGPAIGRVFNSMNAGGALRLRAFVSATGSAGTIAAGDYLKDVYGSATVAVEALECPTLLCNGFGEHRIQGIGDKHVPLIHNAMATDMVVAVSDRATDALNVVFNTGVGRELLAGRYGVDAQTIEALSSFGGSSICNILAAIKVAKHHRLGADDVVATIATDGAEMYTSEVEKTLASRYRGAFGAIDAAEAWGEYVLGATTDNMLELTRRDRERIFNLGYFTWVEQQGTPLEEFAARASESFWRDLQRFVPAWDAMIAEVNAEATVAA
ncbi:MAG TPA: pyridoxal-phosphate dependent enzyme [Thermoanaerobaculia bacterium]|nr:pyridoxal-phosphate dependent enzyme [Thermoanaerobaculia bacterium]